MDTLATRPGAQRFWRLLATWRFRLFQRHRHRRLSIETVAGVPLIIFPDVFNPNLFRTGAVMARHVQSLTVAPDTRVLDMGTGSGIGAIFAAKHGAHVVAVDITEEAVRCARVNALINALEDRIDVRRGDLFAPVEGEMFDLILFNPPFYVGEPVEPWEHAWRSTNVVERFVTGLPRVLAPDGKALVILSTDAPEALEILRAQSLPMRILRQETHGHERLLLIELRA